MLWHDTVDDEKTRKESRTKINKLNKTFLRLGHKTKIVVGLIASCQINPIEIKRQTMCKVLTAKRGGQKATGIALKAKKGGQSNQGKQKRLKLKWSKNLLQAKLTESLQLLKGEYDDKSVNWFGEKLLND